MTRAGVEYVLDKHARKAAATCSSLQGRSVSPHQLRHSCALIMLQATRDIRKVALWLGHAEVHTTESYLRIGCFPEAGGHGGGRAAGAPTWTFQGADALIASLSETAAPPH